MKTVGQLLATRKTHSFGYRMRLALRDHPDYSNDGPKPEPVIKVRGLTHKERDEFNQLKLRMNHLDNKLNKRLDDKAKDGF